MSLSLATTSASRSRRSAAGAVLVASFVLGWTFGVSTAVSAASTFRPTRFDDPAPNGCLVGRLLAARGRHRGKRCSRLDDRAEGGYLSFDPKRGRREYAQPGHRRPGHSGRHDDQRRCRWWNVHPVRRGQGTRRRSDLRCLRDRQGDDLAPDGSLRIGRGSEDRWLHPKLRQPVPRECHRDRLRQRARRRRHRQLQRAHDHGQRHFEQHRELRQGPGQRGRHHRRSQGHWCPRHRHHHSLADHQQHGALHETEGRLRRRLCEHGHHDDPQFGDQRQPGRQLGGWLEQFHPDHRDDDRAEQQGNTRWRRGHQ